jgi:hypothetical protein
MFWMWDQPHIPLNNLTVLEYKGFELGRINGKMDRCSLQKLTLTKVAYSMMIYNDLMEQSFLRKW